MADRVVSVSPGAELWQTLGVRILLPKLGEVARA